ncbi:uncharacterized protein METZ01_LOCUS510249, partial [marine metagenome]
VVQRQCARQGGTWLRTAGRCAL